MEKISVDRYMLIVTIERKIYQPLFFKDIKEAQHQMCITIAAQMKMDADSLAQEFFETGDIEEDDFGITSMSAWADNYNHDNVDCTIFDLNNLE